MDNKHRYKHAPELPDDVLHLIVHGLSSLVCSAAFRSVCKSWRSFFLQHYSYLVPPPPPWIMLPTNAKCSKPSVYGLYDFEDRKLFYEYKIPGNYEVFFESSGTWLIFLDNEDKKLRVWNPLSLIEVSLPCVTNQEKTAVTYCKVIVSCGPLIKKREDVLVGVVINYDRLVVIRLGDEGWTNIDIDSFPCESHTTTIIHNLVFYKGKFYLVNQSGKVFICDENVHAPRNHDQHYCHPIKAIRLADPIDFTSMRKPTPDASIQRYYLVEVEGELMQVIQFWPISNIHYFWVFKLNFAKKAWEFVNRSDLKVSLFLNYCHGTMAAREVSRRPSIYFMVSNYVDEENQEDYLNYKVMVSDSLTKKSTPKVVSEVTKLHRHSHAIGLIFV
ncbi:hypothetical protein Sjap_010913 [Stephania japonica]|uniref:KIB1-4 beta-propeller domain-containing protein n=1 Tax=Stephania japonica TaxID=461633 RepID=A0AAP0JCC9_9MAGN